MGQRRLWGCFAKGCACRRGCGGIFGGGFPRIPEPIPGWIRLLGKDCVCSPLPGAYQCCLSPLATMAFAFGAGQRVLLQSCWGVIVTGCYCDGVLLDIIDPLNPPHLSCHRNPPSGPCTFIPTSPHPL